MNRQFRMAFREAVRQHILKLQELGYDVPDEIKRRDRREPRASEKELMEDRMTSVVKRHFKHQRKKFEEWCNHYFWDRKATIITPMPPGFDDLWDDDEDEFIAALIRLVLTGAIAGAEIFEESVSIGLDYTLVNDKAAKWARKHALKIADEIDTKTVTTVQNALAAFIETPGMTVGDLIDRLPFDEKRAQMVAITETTRAYAQGQKLAGEELKEQWPGVRIIKTWYTNNDEKVCDSCAELDGMIIDHDEDFYPVENDYQDGNPPLHVNCRCWMSESTKLE